MRIVVTAGMGIGPEVTLKALASHQCTALVLGDEQPIADWSKRLGTPIVRLDEPGFQANAITAYCPAGGLHPAVASIELGVQMCLRGKADALVTGPINKAELADAGFTFAGHTGFIGALCQSKPVMAFHAPQLVLSLVTTHVPLSQVATQLTQAKVRHAVLCTIEAVQALGLAQPRVAVTGLNPHAGDQGLLGGEEEEVITPALAGLPVIGPVSAEAAFVKGARGELDAIVAMYHDQGLAPLKALYFGQTVNWTLGIPIIRTSVDHGTADDIKGRGIASADSMIAALRLAEMLHSRALYSRTSEQPETPSA